ncbi:thiamine phosphate synthase [Pseudocolwellia sp. HL-MZ19]|uniref:thiamine phosphate synthase n=1 Tax=Pseudocolwellia sp. HL-MZ19 TaxID=3400846 RepID=UPI003CF42048
MTGQIQGVANLADILNLATDIPVVAIGGINHERAPEVLATGVDSIAVVTAITEAENAEASVALFRKLLSH